MTKVRRRRATGFDDTRISRSFYSAHSPDQARRMSDALGSPFVPMSDLLSRAPQHARAVHRSEPYFSDMWDGPAQAVFSSASRVQADVREGRLDKSDALLAKTHKRSPDAIWTPRAQAQLGCALMWRTLSGEQMAALTGIRGWENARGGWSPKSARDLWSYNFIHTGKAMRHSGEPLPTFIRPGAFAHFDTVAQPLSYAQWLSVTAGVEPNAGPQAARHNVLTTELMLRIAEYTDVPVVLGELASQLTPMSRTSAGMRRADGCFVREDGMIVAIETIATGKSGVLSKAKEWVNILMSVPDKSLAVIFVTAARNEQAQPLHKKFRSVLSTELITHPGAIATDIHKRLFTVDWSEWFRPDGTIAEDFASLPVLGLRPDASLSMPVEKRFRRVEIGDVDKTPWALSDSMSDDRWSRLMTAPHILAGIPYWLRDERTARAIEHRLDIATIRSHGHRTMPVREFDEPSADGRTSPDAVAAMHPGPIDVPALPTRIAQH